MSKDHDDKFDSEEPELEFSLEEILAEFSDRAGKSPIAVCPSRWRSTARTGQSRDLIPVPPVQKRKGGRVLHFPGGGTPAPAGGKGRPRLRLRRRTALPRWKGKIRRRLSRNRFRAEPETPFPQTKEEPEKPPAREKVLSFPGEEPEERGLAAGLRRLKKKGGHLCRAHV